MRSPGRSLLGKQKKEGASSWVLGIWSGWQSLALVVAHGGAFMGSKMLIPTDIWPPGVRAVKEGGEKGHIALAGEVAFGQKKKKTGH